MKLRRFQQTFIKNALRPDIDTACLSLPRGNGKSFLAAHLITRYLTPGDSLFVNGKEVVQCAGSIEQARIVFGFVRATLEPILDVDGKAAYRFIDSVTRLGITHRASNSKLRIISSNGRTAMGLVNTVAAFADEPGSWEVSGGQLMWDALTGAQGKPGSPLKIIVIGTVAPSLDGWYADMVADGSRGSTYVMALQCNNPDKWDSWAEIRRCNPLTAISADFRKKLIEERNAARLDSRLRARFLSYRLNRPAGDSSTVLLTVEEWGRLIARPVPERKGRPIVAIDAGGGRAWSAATAVYENGRIEAIAVAPGIPSIEAQEKRDRVAAGTYQRLAQSGRLEIAEGLRVQPPAQLWNSIKARWGTPALVICDRFRLAEFMDAIGSGVRIEPRVSRWSEAAADIRALRQHVNDGPFSVEVDSRQLLATSLSTAMVRNDDQGNTRLVKKSTNNTARDDAAAALVLGAGAFARAGERRPAWRYRGAA